MLLSFWTSVFLVAFVVFVKGTCIRPSTVGRSKKVESRFCCTAEPRLSGGLHERGHRSKPVDLNVTGITSRRNVELILDPILNMFGRYLRDMFTY